MDLDFSTSEVRREQRLSSLREAVSGQFLGLNVAPLTHTEQSELEGSVSIREFGGLRVAHFSGSPIAAARTRRHVDASSTDDYLLALHTRGVARASQSGRQITLRAGDLALLDSTRPYTIELANSGPFEHIAYQIPRARLDARAERLERALAFRVPAASDPGRLASPYLQTLASDSWRTSAAATAPLIETGLDLLVSALLLAAGLDAPATSRQTELLRELKHHALSNLADVELSPAAVAEAHYVSVRQLQRLFAREGTTFGAWVREERLRRCRKDLADPRLLDLSIAEIARRRGYRSAAHFTRAFSARYDIGPREFRRAAVGHHRGLALARPSS